MFWRDDTAEHDKYFQSMDDIVENWDRYALQRKMITLRFQNEPIGFDQLESILVDDPRVIIYNDTTLFDACWAALNKETQHDPAFLGKVQLRVYTVNCFCRSNYLNQYPANRLAKFFLPHSHIRFVNLNV